MIKRVTQRFLTLLESYLFIIVLALGAGLLFPSKAIVLAPFATLFLQIVFFLTSLKLDPRKILKEEWNRVRDGDYLWRVKKGEKVFCGNLLRGSKLIKTYEQIEKEFQKKLEEKSQQ